MRRPKHRHHPDIWRARHKAENAWLTRRFVFRVWETALTLDDYYGNPAGTLTYSGLVLVEEDRPRSGYDQHLMRGVFKGE